MLTGKSRYSAPCPISTGEWYNHFMNLANPDGDFFVADADISHEVRLLIESDFIDLFQELNIPISSDEIVKAIKDLKNGKCGGDDLLINELFIHGRDSLCQYLLPLFNLIFDSGIFPDMWRDGLLSPLYKRGNRLNPDNYRGITLLSVLGKLFTRVLNNRLESWAENYRNTKSLLPLVQTSSTWRLHAIKTWRTTNRTNTNRTRQRACTQDNTRQCEKHWDKQRSITNKDPIWCLMTVDIG